MNDYAAIVKDLRDNEVIDMSEERAETMLDDANFTATVEILSKSLGGLGAVFRATQIWDLYTV